MAVTVKRIYEEAKPADGVRILVDRLWPRGVSKERAALHDWMKALAPSDELREWFHAAPAAWPNFRKRYLKELASPEAEAELQQLYSLAAKRKRLTLLFASKDEEHNNAVVLKDLIDGMRKPPTGTGPARVATSRNRKVQSMPRR